MPWDQSRPVPWKRLLIFEAIYVGLFVLFVALFSRDNLASASVSIVVAVIATTLVIVALVKFGYQPNWLKSRAELAEIRAEKIAMREAARAARRGEPPPQQQNEQRYRPAPTRRTSTGATNRQRRTRDTRKR